MVGPGEKAVRRAAVCGGSGGELWKAARAAGADVLLTGEVRYHTALDAAEAGFCLIEIGHDVSERVVLDPLAERLGRWATEIGTALEVEVHREAGPYHWMIGRGV
jgi:putative NIF3 family GTP cyclohydrolase 1 type 2